LALEIVLDIELEHSNFSGNQPRPASILTSVKKYLDLIPEQSRSAGSVYSWKAVQQEALPVGDGVLTPLPTGKDLQQDSHLGTGRESVQPQWTVHAPT